VGPLYGREARSDGPKGHTAMRSTELDEHPRLTTLAGADRLVRLGVETYDWMRESAPGRATTPPHATAVQQLRDAALLEPHSLDRHHARRRPDAAGPGPGPRGLPRRRRSRAGPPQLRADPGRRSRPAFQRVRHRTGPPAARLRRRGVGPGPRGPDRRAGCGAGPDHGQLDPRRRRAGRAGALLVRPG